MSDRLPSVARLDRVTTATDRAAGDPVKHLVALVLANLFWAGNFVFGALAVRQLSPLELTWMRWLGAVPILALLAVVIDRPSPRAIVRDLPRQGVLALFGPIGFCLLSYEAMRHTTSLDAALVGAINPAIIAVCTAVLAGAMIAPRVAAGVVVSLVGVLLVVAKGDVSMLLGLRLGAGELFMLAAVVTWTVYTIAGRWARLPVVTASAVQAVLTTVVLTPAALVVGVHAPPDPALWADVAYVVLFPSVLAFTLWNLGVRGVGAARAGVTLNLIPVFTAVIGLAVGLGIDRWQLIGGSVVIAGVLLSTLPGRHPATGVAGVADAPEAAVPQDASETRTAEVPGSSASNT